MKNKYSIQIRDIIQSFIVMTLSFIAHIVVMNKFPTNGFLNEIMSFFSLGSMLVFIVLFMGYNNNEYLEDEIELIEHINGVDENDG